MNLIILGLGIMAFLFLCYIIYLMKIAEEQLKIEDFK